MSHIVVCRLDPPGKEFEPLDCWLMEYFCDDVSCDCRFVALDAVANQVPDEILASIHLGWESVEFYQARTGCDREAAERFRAGCLDLANPGLDWAEAVLVELRKEVFSDPKVLTRFRRHYEIFRRELRRRERTAQSLAHGGLNVPPSSKKLAGLLGLNKGRRRPRRRF